MSIPRLSDFDINQSTGCGMWNKRMDRWERLKVKSRLRGYSKRLLVVNELKRDTWRDEIMIIGDNK